jgi:hypothetical protein
MTSWHTPCSLGLSSECHWLRDVETSTSFMCSLSHLATLPFVMVIDSRKESPEGLFRSPVDAAR